MRSLKSRRKIIKNLMSDLTEAENEHVLKGKRYEALVYSVLKFILEEKLEEINGRIALRNIL